MFCYQCQETAGCSGCTKSGVCGKRPETAALQDLLIWTTKGLSAVTTQLRREGKTVDASVNHLITENLFTTITNVNFDDDTIRARIEATLETKALLAQLADCSALPEAALWNGTTDEFAAKAVTVGVLSTENEDIRSLRELITYGLKGLAAYTSHANVLLKENEEIDAFLQRALAATLDDSLSAEELTALALETGSYGVQGMALLDEANTSAYGNPEITTVDLGVGTRRAFSSPATICVTSRCCSSRPRTLASMFTHTPKCCLRTTIRRSKNMNILREIMVTPGGNRKKNLNLLMARF